MGFMIIAPLIMLGFVIVVLVLSSKQRTYIEAATIKNSVGTPTYEMLCENNIQRNAEKAEEKTAPVETAGMHVNEVTRLAFLSKLKMFLQETYDNNVKNFFIMEDQDVILSSSVWIRVVFKNDMEENLLIYKVPSKIGFEFSLKNPVDLDTLPTPNNNEEEKPDNDTPFSAKEWLDKYLPLFEEKKQKAEKEEMNFFIFEGEFPKNDDEASAIIDEMDVKGYFLSEIDNGIIVTW